jgi:transposase
MAAKGTKRPGEARETKKQTPTFLLEMPLIVDATQAKHLRAHLEAGRQFYNALLSEGQRRLLRMRADPAWQAARAIPRSRKQERRAAFSALREQYGFSENALHKYAKTARVSWLADHLEAVLAQTLASRAYQALNRVCLGQARRVRFKSRGRGLDSVENKRNDTGLRFVLQNPEEGKQGALLWHDERFAARIDWNDPVVKYALDHRIKYVRLIRRKASSPSAQGADCQGYRYYVQLALEGLPYHKPKHTAGSDTIGLDTGPSTIAIVPRKGEARLDLFCEELTPGEQAIRRLQRKMDRQRRAANPANYDEKGRPKKRGKQGLVWKMSKGYLATRRRKATKERKRKAHRKSLHGCKVHELVHVGSTIHVEKISYRSWQKRYGKSVGLRAPGMFIDHLRRTVASTGGTLIEHPTRTTKLSQFCHGCGKTVRKLLSQRFHHCACGIGPVQRDLYSAFLAAYLETADDHPSCARYVVPWEGAEVGGEARLRAAHERAKQRANAGQVMPQSMGVPRARARLLKSSGEPTQEPVLLLSRGRLAAWKERLEPPVL